MKLNLPNVTNARDLGGMITKYGTVKPNKLLRSGVLNRLEQSDIDCLSKRGLQRVIDLRTETEIANAPDVPMDGVEHINISIVRAVTFGISFEALDGPTLAARLQSVGTEWRKKAKTTTTTWKQSTAVTYTTTIAERDTDVFSKRWPTSL